MSLPTELVSLDDAKTHLSITDTTRDGQIQGFIDAASIYVQNLTGPVVPQTFTEVHDGGDSIICLFNPPILSVTSVTEYVATTGYLLTQVQLGDPTGQYCFSLDDPQSGVIRRRMAGGIVGNFAGGDHNVTVTYVAGQASVPADIRMAVLQDLAGLFQTSQNGPASNGWPFAADQGITPNPIGLFPRVAAILSAPSMRVPAIG